ncbi:MAG: MATE family efflux transporter [Firmicutes bacterium]|nr:MATE family efflux transporter [Bacillota bacterium]
MSSILKQENIIMTQGSILKHIIRFALPLLIGNLLQQTYQLVDMVIVGRCIDDGGKSIAAVGLGTPLIFMMIGFFIGFSTGAGVFISNSYGARNMLQVKKGIKISLWLAACISVVVTIGSITACDWMLRTINTNDEIFEFASVYLKIYAVGFIPMLIYNMGTSVLQALGNSTSPFCYLAITCVMNIILDIVLIGVFNMGVAGAAIATVTAQVIAFLLIISKIKKLSIFKERYDEGSIQTFSGGRIVRNILMLSLPLALQQITVDLSNLILQGTINLLGTSVIAAYGIFGKIDGFVLLPINSFGVAMTTFTGQNFGAGAYERILRGKKIVLTMSVGITLLISTVLLIINKSVVLIFEDTPDIVYATVEMGRIMLPFYFLLAAVKVFTGIFNGVGKPLLGSAALIFSLCIARIGFNMVVFPMMQSSKAVCYSYIFSWIVCLTIVCLEYVLLVKKEIVRK